MAGLEFMRQQARIYSLQCIGAGLYYAAVIAILSALAHNIVMTVRENRIFRQMRRERHEDYD